MPEAKKVFQKTDGTKVEIAPRKGCSVEGCEAPHKAKGLCSTHYNERPREAGEAPAGATPAKAAAPSSAPASSAAAEGSAWSLAKGVLGAVVGLGLVAVVVAVIKSRRKNP